MVVGLRICIHDMNVALCWSFLYLGYFPDSPPLDWFGLDFLVFLKILDFPRLDGLDGW